MNENELKERLRVALEPVMLDSSGGNVVDDLYAVMVDIAREVAQEEIKAFAEIQQDVLLKIAKRFE